MVSEYTVWDAEKQDFALVAADSWRDAIKLGFKRYSYLPRRHLDVRPRTGTGSTPTAEEFNRFMEKHL